MGRSALCTGSPGAALAWLMRAAEVKGESGSTTAPVLAWLLGDTLALSLLPRAVPVVTTASALRAADFGADDADAVCGLLAAFRNGAG
jgi:hypothetical protein